MFVLSAVKNGGRDVNIVDRSNVVKRKQVHRRIEEGSETVKETEGEREIERERVKVGMNDADSGE